MMDQQQAIDEYGGEDDNLDIFAEANYLYKVIDAQYALVVAFMACFIYGRTQNSTFFVKLEILMIFTIELSNIYRGVVEIDGNMTTVKKDVLNFTNYIYFYLTTMAYFYLAFKYWRSSKVISAREKVEDGLMT